MEQFYKLLKEYNIKLMKSQIDFPEWLLQFTEDIPPTYWVTIYNLLKDVDKNKSIIEIGTGYGDVTALLYYLGFKKIICFEMDNQKCAFIDNKIHKLFGVHPQIINQKYPIELDFSPDIILQVNCVYIDNEETKNDYLDQILKYYNANGTPSIYILEVIDDSYKNENFLFPHFVRLCNKDISHIFPECQVTSFVTRKYPQNRVSKTIYKICK